MYVIRFLRTLDSRVKHLDVYIPACFALLCFLGAVKPLISPQNGGFYPKMSFFRLCEKFWLSIFLNFGIKLVHMVFYWIPLILGSGKIIGPLFEGRKSPQTAPKMVFFSPKMSFLTLWGILTINFSKFWYKVSSYGVLLNSTNIRVRKNHWASFWGP